MEISAPAHWHTVDFLSDLHLDRAEAPTTQTFLRYLKQTPAQALFLLGDIFEVWIGDDALQVDGGIEQHVAAALRVASQRAAIFIMGGNRDFLMGDAFMHASGAQALQDPSVLYASGQGYLLTHGDAHCLGDTAYLAFRAMVRSADWQQQFLSKPLAERQMLGREMRAQSEAHKATARATGPLQWHDLDTQACLESLAKASVNTMIHGHTHHPATHDLGEGKTRWVLSDWDVADHPPRAQVLRLSISPSGYGALQRMPVLGS